MLTTQLLSMERILFNHTGGSKKRLLEFCSRFLAHSFPENNFDINQIFRALYDREQLGTTAIGNSIAIPHCRITNCQTPIGVFFKLKDKINFDAPDKEDVNILFCIFLPKKYSELEDRILTKVCNVLKQGCFAKEINSSLNAEDIFTTVQKFLLIEEEEEHKKDQKILSLEE